MNALRHAKIFVSTVLPLVLAVGCVFEETVIVERDPRPSTQPPVYIPPPAPLPVACWYDDDCRSSEFCNEGYCDALPGCRSDWDCGYDEFCATDNLCYHYDACYYDHECGSGSVCDGGVCVWDNGCWSDLDCDWGYYCGYDGDCWRDTTVCLHDGECASGYFCGSDGACWDQRLANFCWTDWDCVDGFYCAADGYCLR